MTETSAKPREPWASAAAPCTGDCKNTDWNDAFKLRAPHPTSRAGRGTSRFPHRAHSSVDRQLLVRYRVDAHAFYRGILARFRRITAPARGLLLANTFQPSCRHARRRFF